MSSKRKIKIAPSILSANFAALGYDIKKCEEAGADLIHVDVMDGHFVPNITIGPLVVSAIRKITKLPLDCHLMIMNPENYIKDFVNAGADWISVHSENQNHLHRVLSLIKDSGKKAGLALNPVTPLEFAYQAAEFCDFILLMSVNPGFGGQRFIPSFFKRASTLRKFLNDNGLEQIEIQVDGGVKIQNAAEIAASGADILVCGSGIFEGNIIENILKLKKETENI